MKKNRLPGTPFDITPVAFGTAPLGSMPGAFGYEVDEARARATIHAVFDSPANLIDTSRNYGYGRSEERIGAVLRERGGLPEGFVLSTKLDRDDDTNRFDGDQAMRSAEASLKALGIDRFDILYLHDPEHARDLSEITREGGALDVLFRLKEQGLARAVGLGMGKMDMLLDLARAWPFDVVLTHNRHTLLNRSAGALFDLARERGFGLINGAPYAGGVLAKGSAGMQRITYQEVSDEALDPVRRLETLCREHGVPLGALALQFSMRSAGIATTIVGVSKPERVRETMDWATADIPQALWDAVDSFPYETADPEANRVYDAG